MLKSPIRLLVAGTALFLIGCTHSLEVKNINSYQNLSLNPLEKRYAIGILPSSSDLPSQQLIKGVGSALGRYSATVLLPYSPGNSREVDFIAAITVKPEYKGSGWNFLINWPGFLVFAPAWNGYVYKAQYQVEILLTQGMDNTKVDSWTVSVDLDLRHAEIDRTWTEIGWLEFGIIPLFGGMFFTQYDPDVTPLIGEKIEAPIGDFIAQDIVNRINTRL